MRKPQTVRGIVEFSKPDNMNTVTVFRVLPDSSTEPIGRIYPDLSNGEDSLIYISTNNQGEELFPPTADFIEIEERFKNYAKELSEISFTEYMKAEAEKYVKREESIKSIRNWGIKNKKIHQIQL